MTASHASVPSSSSPFASARRWLSAAFRREARRLARLIAWSGGQTFATARGSLFESLEGRRLLTGVTIELGAGDPTGEGEQYGGYLYLPATVTTPDPYATYVVSVDWGDGSPTDTFDGPLSDISHVYVDGDATCTITATVVATWCVTDADGNDVPVTGSDKDTKTVTVENVEPTFDLDGAAEVLQGEAYSLSVTDLFDPGQDTVQEWTVDWGDGGFDTYSGYERSFAHVYEEGGHDRTITVTAIDEDGSYGLTLAVAVKLPEVFVHAAGSANEGGGATALFVVSRNGNSALPPKPLNVTYTVSGTADAGTDYERLPGTVTIKTGEWSANILVTATPDADALEPEESILVQLTVGAGYTLARPRADGEPLDRAGATINGRSGFVDNGRTAEQVSHWVRPAARAGGQGNHNTGAIHKIVAPEIESGFDNDSNIAWARVKVGTGVVVVERSYTGQKAGDQGVGAAGSDYAGKRVYISPQFASDIDAHEYGHVTATANIYARTLRLAEEAAGEYRSNKLWGAAGRNEAQVRQELMNAIKWEERRQAFVDKDTAVNSGNGNGTFHGWEGAQGGGPDAGDQGPGLIGGVNYHVIHRSRVETQPGVYRLPNYADFDPWA